MNEKTAELVIHVSKVNRFGKDYIVCEPMALQEGDAHPVNLSWSSWFSNGALQQYADLEMNAYVSDCGKYTHANWPEFPPCIASIWRGRKAWSRRWCISARCCARLTREKPVICSWLLRKRSAPSGFAGPDGQRGTWLSDHTWTFLPVTEVATVTAS